MKGIRPYAENGLSVGRSGRVALNGAGELLFVGAISLGILFILAALGLGIGRDGGSGSSLRLRRIEQAGSGGCLASTNLSGHRQP